MSHSSHNSVTVGKYLAARLVAGGVSHFFTVPGDFTLALLDELQSEPELNMVGCCNELNASYAADGYCRETGGIGCVVVTYMVGSLSAINGVAGAYAENLPLLVIAGGPNTLDEQSRHTVHHTIGEADLNQSARCYEPVVAKVLCIRHIQDVQAKIDEALHICGTLRKPVYLEIACNLTVAGVMAPMPLSSLYFRPHYRSDEASLHAAIECIVPLLHHTPKIVLVAGAKLRCSSAAQEFLALANALGCGVAVMPDAKGLFSEQHPQYMGCYWVGVSSRHVQDIVESADIIITAGAVMSDYTTVGWTSLLPVHKTLVLDTLHCVVGGKHFSQVCLKHVLGGLAGQAPHRPQSLESFRRYVPTTIEKPSDITAARVQAPSAPLSLRFLLKELQKAVTSRVASVMAETGDSWFIGQKLLLCDGVKYHAQMQYGSCGWALGASLGVGIALKERAAQAQVTARQPARDGDNAATVEESEDGPAPQRVIALIGDGSFQFTAQELTNMIRQQVDVTIILVNNRTYTIEVQIHDGEYNKIMNWKYAELVNVFRDADESALGLRVTTDEELTAALEKSVSHRGVLLIECCISKDDCTSNLLEWGSRVAQANMRV